MLAHTASIPSSLRNSCPERAAGDVGDVGTTRGDRFFRLENGTDDPRGCLAIMVKHHDKG
jgi:hypothetical protein